MDREDDLSDSFMCRENPLFENKDLFSVAKIAPDAKCVSVPQETCVNGSVGRASW